MLRLDTSRSAPFCDGLTSRDFLHVGALAPLGLTLPQFLAAAPERNADVNCIMLFLLGGPSHIDTWDPKPGRPLQNRGPFDTIATRLPGVRFCEHLPKHAAMLDRFTGTAEVNDALIAQVPLLRRGTPDELANAIVFISSPEASYIAGTVFEVDGGMTAN